MASILRLFERMAATAKIAAPTMNTVIAMAITQSGESVIDAAKTRHGRLFTAYIFVLVLTALFTWLVWDSGNKERGAIQADANARIEEAKKVAATANERARKLENDNLKLRTDLNTESGKVAGLQTDAADAKAAQQRVEIELAKQQERAATAERALLELQERVKPRHLSAEQRKKLIEVLTPAAKGPIKVSHLLLDEEGRSFATQIDEALIAAGWSSDGVGKDMIFGGATPVGVALNFHSAKSPPPHTAVLFDALSGAGLSPTLAENPHIPEGTVEILVGIKP